MSLLAQPGEARILAALARLSKEPCRTSGQVWPKARQTPASPSEYSTSLVLQAIFAIPVLTSPTSTPAPAPRARPRSI